MSLENRYLIVDLLSGAMDGMYDESGLGTAHRVAELLLERHPGSCWVVVKVESTYGRVPAMVPTDSLWHTNKLGLGVHAAEAVK